MPKTSTPAPLPPQSLSPSHDEIHNPRRQHALQTDLPPIPPPATPFPTSPSFPIPHLHLAVFLFTADVDGVPFAPRSFPPQVARHPDLDAATHGRRRAHDGPDDHWTFFVFENGECEVCGWPTDSLERDQSDEGRQWRVV
jgi:hypothetical protein